MKMKKILKIVSVIICTCFAKSIQEGSIQIKIGCENTTISLICPNTHYVSIIRANYGRFSISVCNVQSTTDIDTHCDTEETTTAALHKLCNKLSFCHVLVNSDTFPSSCLDTPKYIEVHYRCTFSSDKVEETYQSRFPRMGGNISDVWSNRKHLNTVRGVEEAVRTGIINQRIPITDHPKSASLGYVSGEGTDISIARNKSSPMSIKELNGDIVNAKKTIDDKIKTFDTFSESPLTKVELTPFKNSQDSGGGQHLSAIEISIIILSSSISVLFIIISSVFIIQKHRKVIKPNPCDSMQMSGTGSSSQSQYGGSILSTLVNSENFVNFQQKFCHFNPDTPNPHYNEFEQAETHSTCGQGCTEECFGNMSDQSQRYVQSTSGPVSNQNSDYQDSNPIVGSVSNRIVCVSSINPSSQRTTPNPSQKHPCDKGFPMLKVPLNLTSQPCNCNIHILYNISYSPCCISLPKNTSLYSNLVQHGVLQPIYDSDTLVCDL